MLMTTFEPPFPIYTLTAFLAGVTAFREGSIPLSLLSIAICISFLIASLTSLIFVATVLKDAPVRSIILTAVLIVGGALPVPFLPLPGLYACTCFLAGAAFLHGFRNRVVGSTLLVLG